MPIKIFINIQAVMLLLFLSPSVQADWLYRFIGYDCDKKNDRLIVFYKGVYNEEGEAILNSKRKNMWDTWELINKDKQENDDYISPNQFQIKTGVCALKHAKYNIRIGPSPGNLNVQGRCGAVMSVWVEVRRGKKTVLPRYFMEGDCLSGETVVTNIIFTSGSLSPEVKQISVSEFGSNIPLDDKKEN